MGIIVPLLSVVAEDAVLARDDLGGKLLAYLEKRPYSFELLVIGDNDTILWGNENNHVFRYEFGAVVSHERRLWAGLLSGRGQFVVLITEFVEDVARIDEVLARLLLKEAVGVPGYFGFRAQVGRTVLRKMGRFSQDLFLRALKKEERWSFPQDRKRYG